MIIKIAFLGPSGTFTEEALDKYIGLNNLGSSVKKVPYSNIGEVIKSVDRGEVSEGIVPIENSLEGSVNITLDFLTFESEARIIREITVPIKHSLIGKKNTSVEKIKKIISHPHATAQCKNYISSYLKHASIIAANSTAEAIKILKEEDSNIAAIGTKTAAKIYGLIVCFLKQDRPGSLYNILKEFADRNINLTRLESRPAKKNLGDYVFLIDLDGHLHDKDIYDAIDVLRKKVYLIKILGSYPKWS